MRQTIGKAELELLQGDITQQDTDAIVNAANPSLMGGGGVDGAIHRAGGPAILEECKRVRAKLGQRLPRGDAVMTTGGDLPARHVIHTAGPVWGGGESGEPELLGRCYRSSMELARRHGLESVAFPSISTGVYGYPVREAARIALREVARHLVEHGAPRLVRFVLFDRETLSAYEDAMGELDTVISL
jgi:O-acetyl-ADP-ribose deacetylase (regulator of RNase III)